MSENVVITVTVSFTATRDKWPQNKQRWRHL